MRRVDNKKSQERNFTLPRCFYPDMDNQIIMQWREGKVKNEIEINQRKNQSCVKTIEKSSKWISPEKEKSKRESNYLLEESYTWPQLRTPYHWLKKKEKWKNKKKRRRLWGDIKHDQMIKYKSNNLKIIMKFFHTNSLSPQEQKKRRRDFLRFCWMLIYCRV